MQNRNIEERLQILNDYIQRTIDALNATRQVAAQTLGAPWAVQQGLSHTPYMNWQPQFIQTPQGLMPVNVNPYFAPVQQVGPFGYGVHQQPQFVPNYAYGLQHSSVLPQWSNLNPWTNVHMGYVPYGVPQFVQQGVPVQGIAQQPQPNFTQTQV